LLVITSDMSVRFGQSCAHLDIATARLLRSLGVNAPGRDRRIARLGLAQVRRIREAAHGSPPVVRVEANEGHQKRIAAYKGAEALNITAASQPHELPRQHPQAASWLGHFKGSRARVPREDFDIVASDDHRGALVLRDAHALFPLTIMPICVSKYSPALSFFQCFRDDLGNLTGEVRQRVVVDHGRVHGRVPAVLLDLARVLDPFEPGRDR